MHTGLVLGHLVKGVISLQEQQRQLVGQNPVRKLGIRRETKTQPPPPPPPPHSAPHPLVPASPGLLLGAVRPPSRCLSLIQSGICVQGHRLCRGPGPPPPREPSSPEAGSPESLR